MSMNLWETDYVSTCVLKNGSQRIRENGQTDHVLRLRAFCVSLKRNSRLQQIANTFGSFGIIAQLKALLFPLGRMFSHHSLPSRYYVQRDSEPPTSMTR